MKIRQLIVTVKLLENDSEDFPTPTLPKVLYKGNAIFIGEDIKPAFEATRYLAGCIGLGEVVLNEVKS